MSSYKIFDWESSLLRSFLSGLYSFTVGKKFANFVENGYISPGEASWAGEGEDNIPLYLRLEVSDLDDPKFDLEDLFLLSFNKLFI